MLKNIVVPLDGSTFGEHALPMATTLGRKSRATVHLIHVVPPLATTIAEAPYYVDVALEKQIQQHQIAQHQKYLDHVAARVREQGRVTVTSQLIEGEPAEAIRAYADQVPADLLIATTHGRGAIARFWLGSVSDELIRHANEPLLLIHPSEGEADIRTDVPVKRILVAMDGTTLAEQILVPAVELAQACGATLLLLRVIKPVFVASYPMLEAAALTREVSVLTEQVQSLQTQLEQEASRYLEDKARDLRARGLAVETRVDVAESPATAILEEAKGVEVVAMETHARGGLTRFFLGSITDKVVRGCTNAILVQHPAK